MAANTAPIYTIAPQLSNDSGTGMNAAILLAAADYTGISANYRLVHTADPTNGSYVKRLRLKAIGTNVASVMRIFLNNGSTPGTATNNSFIGEIGLPATTASTTAPTVDIDYQLDFAIPAGWRLYAGLGAAVASGWVVTCFAGDY